MTQQKYAALTFQNVDQAKWARIQNKVKEALGIDMSKTMGSATAKGVTISWVFSSDMQTLVVDLVKREFFDPSEKEIDQKIADWIASA
jgi:hypothetical protein